MRIYINKRGTTLGPYSANEAVAEIEKKTFTEHDPAYTEGDPIWYTVREILRYAGITPSGRPISTKLQPPSSYIPEIMMPVDEGIFVDEAQVVEPAAGPVTLLRERGWDDPDAKFMSWFFVRKAGVVAPVLVVIAMLLPWITAEEAARSFSYNGFKLFSGLLIPFMVIFMILVLGVSVFAFSRPAGDPSIAFGSLICSGAALAFIWGIVFVARGIFVFHDNLHWGGGLQLATAVLVVIAGLSLVPLRHGPTAQVNMFGAIGAAICGLFFFVQSLFLLAGTIGPNTDKGFTAADAYRKALEVKYGEPEDSPTGDEFFDGVLESMGKVKPESGELKAKVVGGIKFFVPAEWEFHERGSARILAMQSRPLVQTENTYMDQMQWAVYPATSPTDRKFFANVSDEASFRAYLVESLIPVLASPLKQSPEEVKIESVKPATRGEFTGFEYVLDGFEARPATGNPIPIKMHGFIARDDQRVLNGLLTALKTRFEKQALLFQKCLDASGPAAANN